VNASVLTISTEMRLREAVATMAPEGGGFSPLVGASVRGASARAYSAEGGAAGLCCHRRAAAGD
jgi:hypothetical protein